MKKLRVLALLHEDLIPPDHPDEEDLLTAPWKTEYDVVSTLHDLRHEVRTVGVENELGPIRQAIEERRPHIALNLLEAFGGHAVYDANIVAYLELLGVPYTGCNPRGLLLSRDKGLSKKLLSYHRVRCPGFAVFPRQRTVRRPRRLEFPLIVKAVNEDASFGIAQASVVHSDEKLRERVEFIHDSVGVGAIAEQYIEGRELYVGVLGNRRLDVFPVWELFLGELAERSRPIATERVKFSSAYQRKHGIRWGRAEGLSDKETAALQVLAKRVYRALELSGYARIDFRLDGEGRPWVLEANPNPDIGYGSELPESAHDAGVAYEKLVQRILNLGLRWHREHS